MYDLIIQTFLNFFLFMNKNMQMNVCTIFLKFIPNFLNITKVVAPEFLKKLRKK